VTGGAPSDSPAREPGRARWLPALLVPVSLLPDLAAALPLRTYFFRDFTVTFLPLRLFAARELRQGRLAFWNPWVFDGSFQLPALYPPDLLHALWPSPAFVSWLLTLHLPLAALGAYWLARELGATRAGAFASGVVLSLCGFTLSTLNLYAFLQALALAPFVAGWLRRSAAAGGRAMIAAGAILALATSTLAVEFVAQAALLGVALGLAAAGRRAVPRLAVALALGAGLAGVPIALVLGLLPETSRGVGFGAEVALGNALHPAVLLQALMPHLFGQPAAPAEAWWGGRFFSKGFPYFLSLYVGPVALALAAVGASRLERRNRAVLVALATLGLWYALGERGGLAPLVGRLPLGAAFRFPGKALLLPHLALALAAGFGVDRLRERAEAFWRLAAAAAAAAVLAVSVAAVMAAAPARLVAWSGVDPGRWATVAGVAAADARNVALLTLAVLLIVLAVGRGLARRGMAAALVTALATADLAASGAGINRQVAPAFFDLLPALAAPLRQAGRVFSYGLDHSPAFRRFLASGSRGATVASFYVYRQLLGPYTSVLDGIETTEATDLTGFAPRARELDAASYDPAQAGAIVPWLRNAGVTRVIGLDALASPELAPLAVVPVGPPGLAIHVYGLRGAGERAYVACRARVERDVERALLRPYEPGFDRDRDVVLESARAPGCTTGSARAGAAVPGREEYTVECDGPCYLVIRASYARGWRARVDGQPVPVQRANGKHRALAIPAGRHAVQTWYEPPGLAAGLGLSVGGLALAAVIALRTRSAG